MNGENKFELTSRGLKTKMSFITHTFQYLYSSNNNRIADCKYVQNGIRCKKTILHTQVPLYRSSSAHCIETNEYEIRTYTKINERRLRTLGKKFHRRIRGCKKAHKIRNTTICIN